MTYALVAIVKNEAARIERMLASAAPYIDWWTIIDTGSTDGTAELVERTMGLVHRVPGTLIRSDFVDFGTMRSLAFRYAAGTGDWLLALDADMTISIDPGFEPDPEVDAYMIEMGSTHGFSNRLPLLLRGDLPWVSVGPVHEYTALEDGSIGTRVATDDIRISMPAPSATTAAKLEWHAELLTKALIVNPKDARSTFYLAQTRRDQGRIGEARALYLQRAGMGGWDEEQFVAAYQAATLAQDWPTKSAELLRAWESRPRRLEPLYDLVAGLNERGQHQAAYRLSDVSLDRPNDVLFVEGAVWEWGLLFERSVAAWWTGDQSTFRRLTRTLLRRDLPAHIRERVEANAALPTAAAA